jgi:sugar/nucleoside kinase (ribokinase family)
VGGGHDGAEEDEQQHGGGGVAVAFTLARMKLRVFFLLKKC